MFENSQKAVISKARKYALDNGAQLFVVRDGGRFHFANHPGVAALFPNAQPIATVHPDGHVSMTRDTRADR